MNVPENIAPQQEMIENPLVEENEETDITSHDIRIAVKKMKNGKSPGIDGLPSEIFKYAEEEGIKWLERIFNLPGTQALYLRNGIEQLYA